MKNVYIIAAGTYFHLVSLFWTRENQLVQKVFFDFSLE